MTEKWIETRIWFKKKILEKSDNYNTLLKRFKNIVEKCNKKLISFHFFFEPDPDLLVRIQIKEDTHFEKTKTIIKNEMWDLGFIKNIDFNESYIGEQKSFGEDGWEIAKRFFEISSRFAISLIDESFVKGKEFNDEKLIHCFCNKVHITYQQEIEFYIRRLKNLGVKIEKKQRSKPE